VTKIFHSCREDIEAIYAWTNKEMINLFDTQVANSFLDGDYAIGYQGLVEQELGIILNKNETRSNWIRRPLSDSQLKYAALDVEYLIYLYEAQKKQLINASKIDWLNQDIEKILSTNTSASHSDLERIIPKAQESKLLFQFNLVVDEISKSQKINPTLFFSKKAQKDFLRLVLLEGLDIACEKITDWRRDLIKENILELLR
jgi:ribonuclease D